MSHFVLPMFRLDEKVALIVGGARHLGYDMAEALAEAGAKVLVADLDEAAVSITAI